MSDEINVAYGALREGVHIGGYSFERAFSRLEWLLTDNRWQQVDGGKYGDVNGFLGSIQLEGFRIVAEQRKRIAARIKELQPGASNRRIAATLGVAHSTINADTGRSLPAAVDDTETTRGTTGRNLPPAPGATETPGADTGPNGAPASGATESGGGTAAPHNHRAQGTGENEWYTPQKYIESARNCLGQIELDPASSACANKAVKAYKFFSQEDDGLRHEWHGKIWLNPPYSQPDIRLFVEKMIEEFRSARTTEAIMLTHNYTDTAWFHLALSEASAVCFTRGRIGFLSPDGKKATPTQGQAFFYYGGRIEEFRKHFSQHGAILRV